MTTRGTVGCGSCESGWQHCHGTWIVHRDSGECAGDPDCVEPAEAHELVVVCEQVQPRCACD